MPAKSIDRERIVIAAVAAGRKTVKAISAATGFEPGVVRALMQRLRHEGKVQARKCRGYRIYDGWGDRLHREQPYRAAWWEFFLPAKG
jgi:transcription initiation factor IIE alpha subunit